MSSTSAEIAEVGKLLFFGPSSLPFRPSWRFLKPGETGHWALSSLVHDAAGKSSEPVCTSDERHFVGILG